MENSRRKPEWLKIKLPMGKLSVEILNTIRGYQLNTIVQVAGVPIRESVGGVVQPLL